MAGDSFKPFAFIFTRTAGSGGVCGRIRGTGDSTNAIITQQLSNHWLTIGLSAAMQEQFDRLRPLRSQQLTPPNAAHSSNTNIWPSYFEVLETPERKRLAAQNAIPRQNNNRQSPTSPMYWNNLDFAGTTQNLSVNEDDSGLGDSFLEVSRQAEEKETMILRPPPVLRTPFVTNTKNLQSPLRSFFFKHTPSPTQTDQLSSLVKSENAIGVRFNGSQLVHLKSPCLLSTIQNQNVAPYGSVAPSSSVKKPVGQRSPLKPCQSTRNLTNDLTRLETPSKGVKLEVGFDGLSPFVSPLKFSQSFYAESFVPDQSSGFLDSGHVDMLDHYLELSNSMDASVMPLSSRNSSPNKSISIKNETLSSFSLSLNSTNESFQLSDTSLDQPGSMTCTQAVRIKVPRFSARAKSLVYGRTTAQREITRQANNFWKRNCRHNYQTNIPLAESLEEFAKIDFKVRSTQKH